MKKVVWAGRGNIVNAFTNQNALA